MSVLASAAAVSLSRAAALHLALPALAVASQRTLLASHPLQCIHVAKSGGWQGRVAAAPFHHFQQSWRAFSDGGSKSSSSFGQPPGHAIKAIPWSVTPAQATEAYHRYHRQQPIFAPPKDYQKLKQAFLPFWAVSGVASVHAHSAQVGFNKTRRRLNPSTGTWVHESYTEWRHFTINRVWERRYTAEQVQMYAGSKYARADVDALKPGANLAQAVPLTPDMMDERDSDSKNTGRLRRVYPFTMTPDTAISRAVRWIRQQEEAVVQNLALHAHPDADQVSDIRMDVRLTDYIAHPIFVPVYVFTVRTPLLKLKMRTFVGAYPGAAVSGTHMLDGAKVGAVVAAVTPLVLLLLGVFMPWTRLFWIGSVLPGAAAGVTAHFFADLRSWFQQLVSARQHEWEAQDHRNWDADWVKGYSRIDSRQQQEQRQQEQWRQRQGAKQGWDTMGDDAGPAPGDSKGYYQLLGVSRSASISEVQAAFRAAAFKYHPDRYTSKADKEQATVMFQKLSDAYSTLRDPHRRKQYDMM